MQDVFAALRQTMRRGESLRLLYASQGGQVGIFFGASSHTAEHVSQLVTSKYPNCAVEPVRPPGLDRYTGRDFVTVSAELSLCPSLFPILRFEQFEDIAERRLVDPIEMLLSSVRPDGLWSVIELVIAPATSRQHRFARRVTKTLDHPFFRCHYSLAAIYAQWATSPYLRIFAWILQHCARSPDGRSDSKTDTTAGRLLDRIDDVQAVSDKVGGHLYVARIRLCVYAREDQITLACRKIERMRAAFSSFTISRLALFRRSLIRVRHGPLPPLHPSRRRSFFLSHCELAGLFHPPTSGAKTDQMATLPFTELPAPVHLSSGEGDGDVVLGRVRHRGDSRTFGITREDRRRHLYVVGKTGMGKTTFLERLIRTDIERGHGVCLIDPHGDLADAILAAVPSHRTNDVIVFDPCDPEFAIAFNPLCCEPAGSIDMVTSGVVSAFKKLYDSWGPRLEDTLRNATYLAVENAGTLLSILQLLTNDAERAQFLKRNADDLAGRFWRDEFGQWSDRFRTEAVAAILNKIRPFLMNRDVRSILCQGGSLDLRQVMDEGKILIANVSKGKLGEDNANLLGALLVTSLQQAAMSRAGIPENERRDFSLYIDEFQNFTTGSFAAILSEARKYRLNLIVAHQYVRQLDDETADAVFGNVGSIVSFQLGSDDAEVLARQLSKHRDQVKPEDLTNLPKYNAYVRLLQNGMPEQPFSMTTLPVESAREDRSAIVRRVSNARYARRKAEVLAELRAHTSRAADPRGIPAFLAPAVVANARVTGTVTVVHPQTIA